MVCLDKVLELAPNFIPAILIKADVLFEKGNYECALSYVDKILASEP
jgi:tetratricopeptide (TPR) repeat protein